MTRLTLLENRIEEFTDRPYRPREDEDKVQVDEDGTSKTIGSNEMDSETKTEKPNKLPPLKLFQGTKTASNSNTDTSSESPDQSSLEQKKIEDKNKEEQSENIMKVGFGKALT